MNTLSLSSRQWCALTLDAATISSVHALRDVVLQHSATAEHQKKANTAQLAAFSHVADNF